MYIWRIFVPLRIEVDVEPLIYLKSIENSLMAHTGALIGYVTYNLHTTRLTALTFARKIMFQNDHPAADGRTPVHKPWVVDKYFSNWTVKTNNRSAGLIASMFSI